MDVEDDYGYYCDLDAEYPSRAATKVYRTNHCYVVTNHYVVQNDPEYYYDTEDVPDVIKDYKEKARSKIFTMCVDFSVFCIFVSTSIYCLYHV